MREDLRPFMFQTPEFPYTATRHCTSCGRASSLRYQNEAPSPPEPDRATEAEWLSAARHVASAPRISDGFGS